jgi:hypothetical protein
MAEPSDEKLFLFERRTATADDFVDFWSGCYEYPDLELYTVNIAGPLAREKLKALFQWKIGPRFFDAHWPAIDRLFVSRLQEAEGLPPNFTADVGLELFAEGGAIYRIFWLHCLRPNTFPIYDQHVHRAMNIIESVPHRELSTYTEKAQVRQYIDRYLPFWVARFAGLDPRRVDQALWSFGKFMNQQRGTSFGYGLLRTSTEM